MKTSSKSPISPDGPTGSERSCCLSLEPFGEFRHESTFKNSILLATPQFLLPLRSFDGLPVRASNLLRCLPQRNLPSFYRTHHLHPLQLPLIQCDRIPFHRGHFTFAVKGDIFILLPQRAIFLLTEPRRLGIEKLFGNSYPLLLI